MLGGTEENGRIISGPTIKPDKPCRKISGASRV
jgi:hypothetical protein